MSLSTSIHEALPTVSVVVPCYNVADYVRTAVESAVAQTLRPLEIICVDDGSTDGTLEVLRELEAEHPGLVRVLTGPNGGAPAARNVGLGIARGEFIQFLDADDILLPEKLAHQVALIGAAAKPPDLVLGASLSRPVGADAGTEHVIEVDLDPWRGLLAARIGNTCSNLWRRARVVDVGGWSEEQRSSQETELMFRMLQHGVETLVDSRPLTLVRKQRESVGTSDPSGSLRRWLLLRKQIVEYLMEHGAYTPERRAGAERRAFRNIRLLYSHDPTFSEMMYRTLISDSFDPSGSVQSRVYLLLYRSLGFRWAERIMSYLNSIRGQ